MAYNISKIAKKIGLENGLLSKLKAIRNSVQLVKKTKTAVAWYKENIANLLGMNAAATRAQAIKQANIAKVSSVEIGSMFQFVYDAKWKNELPYWDKFPLTIIVEIYPDGFLGLNLHYLAPPIRAVLLDQLMSFKSANLRTSLPHLKNELTPDTVLKLSWSLLKSSTKHHMVYPCVKRYLYTHVQSNFLKVNPLEWEHVIFLPIENFQKQTKEYVWDQSGY